MKTLFAVLLMSLLGLWPIVADAGGAQSCRRAIS
jgi:hypothetical protein